MKGNTRIIQGKLNLKCEETMSELDPKKLRFQARDMIEQGVELLRRADEIEKQNLETDTVNLKDEMQKIFYSGKKIII